MRYQYQTNVFGTLDVTTAVLPYMRKRKSWFCMIDHSHILNVDDT